jgi:ABC-type taurine transport system ATPase subunit
MTNVASGQPGANATAAAGSAIRVQGLGKRYGSLEVFRDVNMDVGEREIVAIVGPSGCGKTTLLRCIDGLMPVDEGEIWCGDQRVTEPVAGMAMVFQHFGLFPVEDGLRQRRLRPAHGRRAEAAEIAERVPHFIKMVGLTGFEQAYPLADVRRHAAALRAGPRARDRAERAADGRAVSPRSTRRPAKSSSSNCCASGRRSRSA